MCRMSRFFLIFSIVLVLGACGTATQRERVIERGLDAGAIIEGPTAKGHVYAEYGPGADRFPPPRLLFFASSDPFSADIDEALRSLYENPEITASTFRVPFGHATGAQLQYKVLLPGSIVVITTSGAELPLLHPSVEVLRSLLLPPTPELI